MWASVEDERSPSFVATKVAPAKVGKSDDQGRNRCKTGKVITLFGGNSSLKETAPVVSTGAVHVNKPTNFLFRITRKRAAILSQISFQCAAVPGFL